MSRGCGGSERSFVPPGHRRAIRHPVAPDAGFPAALGAGNRRRGVGAHLVRDSRKARVLEIPETESRAGGAGDATPRTMRRRGTRKRESTSDPECTTTSVRLSARVACCGAAPRRVGPPESPLLPLRVSRLNIPGKIVPDTNPPQHRVELRKRLRGFSLTFFSARKLRVNTRPREHDLDPRKTSPEAHCRTCSSAANPSVVTQSATVTLAAMARSRCRDLPPARRALARAASIVSARAGDDAPCAGAAAARRPI